MNSFLEHLKLELEYRDLTQKELSQMADISVNTIRGWFSKDLTPDVFSAIKVAKALNVSVEYLAGVESSLNGESNIYKQKYENLVKNIQSFLDKSENLSKNLQKIIE